MFSIIYEGKLRHGEEQGLAQVHAAVEGPARAGTWG